MPALADELVPIIGKTTTATRGFLPVLAGLRPYAPDLVAGLFNGFGGVDQRLLRRQRPLRAHRLGVRRGLGLGLGSLIPAPPAGRRRLPDRPDRPLPGAAVEPAADGSNPWVDDPASATPQQSR